jgi:flagellar hook-basal body complex protein FliE
MDSRGINQLLSEMRAMGQAAGNKPVKEADAGSGVNFGQILQDTMRGVSTVQQQADDMTNGFVAGDQNVNLQDVMINLQKASLSFQQMVQVRNKLVSAYQDMMNMQV